MESPAVGGSMLTFAKLILEIRRRAAAMPQGVPRASAIEQAAGEVLKDPGGPAERILAALVGITDGRMAMRKP